MTMTAYILLILLLFSVIIVAISVDYGFGIGVRGRGDILLEEFLFTNATPVPANLTIKFKYVATVPVSFIEFVSDNNIQTEITFFKRHTICLRIMDRFVYSLNGTLVVYGYDNFDEWSPSARNDAVLLPKRRATNGSELDDLLETSFCTVPRITFEDLRNSFNESEYDIVNDADDNNLLGYDLSPNYYAESDDDADEMPDVITDSAIPQQRNCSIPKDAFIRFYPRNDCASISQHCLLIINLVLSVFYCVSIVRS